MAALILGARFTTTETETHPPVTLPDPTDESAAIVIGRHKSGGFSLFGLQFGSVTSTIDVQFYAPPGCRDLVATGDAWPVAHPECAVPIAISGVVSGGGIAPTGETIMTVSLEVDRACYDAVALGDAWPPAAGCRSPAAG